MTQSIRKTLYQKIQHDAELSLGWFAALLAFSIPVSTSAVSVMAVLILTSWLIGGDYSRKLKKMMVHPVSLAVLVYLGLFILGLLWSQDTMAGLAMVEKQWKLLLLPVLISSIVYEHRRRYVVFFLAGLMVAMLMTYLAWFDILHYGGVTPEHPSKRLFHVVYNPLLAFGFYLVCHEILWGRTRGIIRAGLVLFSALMAFDMFITEGRTGQITFFMLSGLLVFQFFSKSILKAFFCVLLLLPLVFIAGYQLSPTFHKRVNTAGQEIVQFKENPNTSVGLRLLFWKNSWQIIKSAPIFGVGTGDFQTSYAVVNAQHSPEMVVTDNPHNQYVFILCHFGILGLICLLAIFFALFREALCVRDDWQRIRFAFPLFFLTIMLAESYLLVYETGFLFALFGAVLYLRKPDQRMQPLLSEGKKCWLILSYRANIEGSACSQHIDDRLPFFREQGIEPLLLTGPVGEQSSSWLHVRTHSLAPSGVRFEVRHFLRKHLHKRWQFKVVETILLLPVFPFYLLEKILINLESEWSWFFLASVRGFFICRRYKPEVMYSTGGSASAHAAALLIKRWTGIKWLAETQDPIVHDHDWQRSKIVLRVYTWLEKKICNHADAFIFLVHSAMEHTAKRVQGHCRGAVIYPGSVPAFFEDGLYEKGNYCHFAHFGSLAGSRNMVVFFQALGQVLEEDTSLRSLIRVDLYGSFDGASEREMERLQLNDLVLQHGSVNRRQALTFMQQTDCLLLIQNIIFFSCETIPSKVYEYLLAGRPILGLLQNNEELKSMLTENGHQAVPADDVHAVAAAIHEVMTRYKKTPFLSRPSPRIWTVQEAVHELVKLSIK
jgi:O-antigen ligase